MKVKIKSKNYFLNHPRYDAFINYVPIGSHFVEEMFMYCDKILNVEKTLFKFEAIDVYTEKKRSNWEICWNEWMFDILPIIDEKKNYLLNFN